MYKLVILLVLSLSFSVFSQTLFMRTYGLDDYGSRVISTSDGGFLVTAWSISPINGK